MGDAPEYIRIQSALRERIRTGEYPENGRLPTERELCEMYGVSRITIRQALQMLESGGLIHRQQGRGTFVNPRVITQPLSTLYTFSEELRRQNITPGTRMLSFGTIPAGSPVSGLLGVESGQPLRAATRLRLADETPYAYETSYIPCEVLGEAAGEEIETHGLYNAMTRHSGVRVDKATETFESIIAPPYVAEALSRRGVLSVMRLDRLAFSSGRAVEYCVCFICGDKVRFTITLT